jgi:hypothetical protein
MKREYIPKGPPFSPEEVETIVAAAPHHVDDPDCPYDQNNTTEVEAYWSKPALPNHASRQNFKKKR